MRLDILADSVAHDVLLRATEEMRSIADQSIGGLSVSCGHGVGTGIDALALFSGFLRAPLKTPSNGFLVVTPKSKGFDTKV
jgi:hypothetical protein